MKAYIKGISYYLPKNILTNEDLVKDFPEWSADKISTKIGVDKRHIAAQHETSTDMAVVAGKLLFEEYDINPSDIDFVILCTQSPDYYLPTSACLVQDRLNIPVKAGAFDFNLGCSGFVYGLAISKGLISAGIAKNILLVTSETYSKYIHPKDKGNRTIFGDAAAATLISNSGVAEIMNFSLGTDGKGANNLIVETGCLRHPNPLNNLHFDESNNPISSDHLYMKGTEILSFTLEMVPQLVKETLQKNNMNMSEIDWFVFHQANKHILNFLRKKIKIPKEKFVLEMDQTGNTVSSTIPIALKETMKKKKILSNQKIMVTGFGVGYSWAGAVLNFN